MIKKYRVHITLFLLGLAIGIVATWALKNDPENVSLFFGALLILVGAVIGFSVEWFIDEARRKNPDNLNISLAADGATIQQVSNGEELAVLAGLLNQKDTELGQLRQQLTTTEGKLFDCLRQGDGTTRDVEQLQTLRDQLQADLNDCRRYRDDIQNQVKTIETELIETHHLRDVDSKELQELRALRHKIDNAPDNLTVIKGIGQVYQTKLNEVGITTYRQLAEADPDRLNRLLGVRNWQATDVTKWILQARDWANQQEQS